MSGRAAGASSVPGWLLRILASRLLPWHVALIALLLSAPSLGLGLQSDDQILRIELARPVIAPDFARGPLDLFAFYRGDRAAMSHAMDLGVAPWWTPLDFKIAFFRPLTGLTHWLDFRLWPDRPWLMHAQSIAWFVAVVAVVAGLYRRLLEPAWVAGLAAVLFAIDDAHAMPVMWIANRNATIAVLFAFLSIVAHDRWRSEGSRLGMVLAPLSLAAGLMGGETALGACAFLFAYAIFLDRGPLVRRLLSLTPAAAVAGGWSILYRMLGYGVTGSSMYIDPGSDPVGFARAVVDRAPLLLFGQFGLPSNIHLLLSQSAGRVMWIVACVVAVTMAVLLVPLVTRDRVARFFATGMLLALLPACGTFADDRLLFVAGFGGTGLLAQFLGAIKVRAPWLPPSRAWRSLAWVAVPPLLVIHLVFAPLSFVGAVNSVRMFGRLLERAGRSLPTDPAIVNQRLIVISTPAAYVSVMGPVYPRLEGRPLPARLLVAGAGIYPIHVSRPTMQSIVVHPEGGFLAPSGSPRPGHERDQPPFDMRYMLPMFDRLYRVAPMARGDTIRLTGVTVEVTAVTPDGRPDEVTFSFDENLEALSLRWVQWRDGVYVPFQVPGVGQSVTLPAVTVPW